MHRRTLRTAAIPVGILILALVATVYRSTTNDYYVEIVMDNAASIPTGAAVLINGGSVGAITDIKVRQGKAYLRATFDSAGPLHTGSTAYVDWRSALGRRQIHIAPGPASSPEIPPGGMIKVAVEQVDVDDLLASLDAPTRKHVSGFVQGLGSTLDGRETDLNDTLRDFSPAVSELVSVAKGLSSDGAAIRSLATDLHRVTQPAAARDDKLTATVAQLTELTAAIAREQEALSKSLDRLPGTLREADKTLEAIGPAVDETRPLLRDLQPVVDKLPSVSRKLEPTLADLRPVARSLRPALRSTSTLLETTPSLLDHGTRVVPKAGETFDRLNPAIKFVRPYTPDLMGWLSNWASAFSTVDSVAGYTAAIIRFGPSSFDENPGLKFTIDTDPAPPPGKSAKIAGRGEPWTDANGSGMQ